MFGIVLFIKLSAENAKLVKIFFSTQNDKIKNEKIEKFGFHLKTTFKVKRIIFLFEVWDLMGRELQAIFALCKFSSLDVAG